MYKARHIRTGYLCGLARYSRKLCCSTLLICLIVLMVKPRNVFRGHKTKLTGPERNLPERPKSCEVKQISAIYRTMNETCTGTLDLPASQTEKKISSYEFPGTELYINGALHSRVWVNVRNGSLQRRMTNMQGDLFPPNSSGKMPGFPYFVTAFSSNHYQEGMRLIHNLSLMLGGRYQSFTLIIYDIGLRQKELEKVRELCNCTTRKFPFEKYPDHVRILKGYAWKPIIIQTIIIEHPFVVWMDTSILFKKYNIDPILEKAKKKKVLASMTGATVASKTLEYTFKVMTEDPCLYRYAPVLHAGFIILYATPYEVKYILKPWVSCALMRGCMVTRDDPELHLGCKGVRHGDFFKCHRFDQSVWSILLNRLYNVHVCDHIVHLPLSEYFIVSKNGRNITDSELYDNEYKKFWAYNDASRTKKTV